MRTEINSSIKDVDLYHNLSIFFFLTSPLTKEMIEVYLHGDVYETIDIENDMVEFIAGHLRDEIAFSTSLPIMDAIESIINENISSKNIQLV